jgi:hypothetical protein
MSPTVCSSSPKSTRRLPAVRRLLPGHPRKLEGAARKDIRSIRKHHAQHKHTEFDSSMSKTLVMEAVRRLVDDDLAEGDRTEVGELSCA